MEKNVIILPSLYNADFLRLSDCLTQLENAGIEYLHFDVMDGNFVPNLGLNLELLKQLNQQTHFKMDCHLMVKRPETLLNRFITGGANMITIHAESTPQTYRVIQEINEHHILSGIAINPGTPVSAIKELLPLVDVVLVMTVNPGVNGQKFIPSAVNKVYELFAYKQKHSDCHYHIEVDGGINDQTAPLCAKAGANMFVSGSFLFSGDRIDNQLEMLVEAINKKS
ncbi:ribulose-phosphate 3-epimerase [Heyndrickxia acidiproducens]|uniref:ribulose-phosphate 3-epimerase n=1 Tax=Heyndrickxia acidiproducens TaxID=1121084 RepID=UPI0003800951|nr:ribulose-phosphate 3-epimerase [Heyndrickxia acidiproducens]